MCPALESCPRNGGDPAAEVLRTGGSCEEQVTKSSNQGSSPGEWPQAGDHPGWGCWELRASRGGWGGRGSLESRL